MTQVSGRRASRITPQVQIDAEGVQPLLLEGAEIDKSSANCCDIKLKRYYALSDLRTSFQFHDVVVLSAVSEQTLQVNPQESEHAAR